ncbi:lipoprotein insertase outer membrane protein LolB [Psychrosphaera aquimarina]|uniref:Outer-membrane lipoprotein LolB n=1 Tax=Psychrosphaera aquimarina TaxID=2044854 RepID=A0ABU3QWZ9_9GAMM|nr:lipoprotein insertase outer membrane protein LolB [Psychrosphaera aquimarina]MDU0111962.1 lipoprotein insertase outer membrane protein LolB [Psychrosphaera aquimarina]MDU0111984.1 lipoprotein insertase outer membrane protein LolB [Psychrosphaera aquimarina]
MKPFQTIFLRVSILLLALFLSACSTLNQFQTAPKELPLDIKKLDSWTVRGKVLIKTETENLSGYFYWQKQQDSVQFSLNTFIGTNILTLTTKNNLSTLEVDGKVYKDRSASRLIRRTTGIQLPLEKLELWIRGQLAGKEKSIIKNGNQIKQFDYTGTEQKWQVKYSKFQQQKIYTLPMLINLTTKGTKLKLSVSNWEFD